MALSRSRAGTILFRQCVAPRLLRPLAHRGRWLVIRDAKWLYSRQIRPLCATASVAVDPVAAEPAGGLERDPDLQEALQTAGCAVAARMALDKFGKYSGNEVRWQSFGRELQKQLHVVEEEFLAEEAKKRRKEFHKTADKFSAAVGELKSLVQVLAEEAEFYVASFWEQFNIDSEKVLAYDALETDDEKKKMLQDLTDMGWWLTRINSRAGSIFNPLIKWAIRYCHILEAKELTNLISLLGASGTVNRTFFVEVSERLLDPEDLKEFNELDLLAIVSSMAKLKLLHKGLLQHLGREMLHKKLPDLQPAEAIGLLQNYGDLGFRHDTVFKEIAKDILQENAGMQRQRALGEASMLSYKYKAADLATVLMAMFRLKMHRGDTSWWRKAEDYEDLVEILSKRIADELSGISARALAEAAVVLGEARHVDDDLCVLMFDEMCKILSDGERFRKEMPQYELPAFLKGLVKMGRGKKKGFLDFQFVSQWICQNVYAIELNDLVFINRHLADLGFREHAYYQVFVPYLMEREAELTQDMITEITNTYNIVELREEHVGRHFFWLLGIRFQKAYMKSIGLRKRPELRRLG